MDEMPHEISGPFATGTLHLSSQGLTAQVDLNTKLRRGRRVFIVGHVALKEMCEGVKGNSL